MYYTHHFANHETLSRARTWLACAGFGPETIEMHTDGIPRLTLTLAPTRWACAEMLINAVERSDPQGWPGLWDVASQAHVYPEVHAEHEPAGLPRPHATQIGWHPEDLPRASDPDHDLIARAMRPRQA